MNKRDSSGSKPQEALATLSDALVSSEALKFKDINKVADCLKLLCLEQSIDHNLAGSRLSLILTRLFQRATTELADSEYTTIICIYTTDVPLHILLDSLYKTIRSLKDNQTQWSSWQRLASLTNTQILSEDNSLKNLFQELMTHGYAKVDMFLDQLFALPILYRNRSLNQSEDDKERFSKVMELEEYIKAATITLANILLSEPVGIEIDELGNFITKFCTKISNIGGCKMFWWSLLSVLKENGSCSGNTFILKMIFCDFKYQHDIPGKRLFLAVGNIIEESFLTLDCTHYFSREFCFQICDELSQIKSLKRHLAHCICCWKFPFLAAFAILDRFLKSNTISFLQGLLKEFLKIWATENHFFSKETHRQSEISFLFYGAIEMAFKESHEESRHASQVFKEISSKMNHFLQSTNRLIRLNGLKICQLAASKLDAKDKLEKASLLFEEVKSFEKLERFPENSFHYVRQQIEVFVFRKIRFDESSLIAETPEFRQKVIKENKKTATPSKPIKKRTFNPWGDDSEDSQVEIESDSDDDSDFVESMEVSSNDLNVSVLENLTDYNRKKNSSLKYIPQYISALDEKNEDSDLWLLALAALEHRIRRKPYELNLYSCRLVQIIIFLENRFGINTQKFAQLRLKSLVALTVVRPRLCITVLRNGFFSSETSVDKKCLILDTLYLAVSEMSDQNVLNESKQNDKLEKKVTNPVGTITRKFKPRIEHQLVQNSFNDVGGKFIVPFFEDTNLLHRTVQETYLRENFLQTISVLVASITNVVTKEKIILKLRDKVLLFTRYKDGSTRKGLVFLLSIILSEATEFVSKDETWLQWAVSAFEFIELVAEGEPEESCRACAKDILKKFSNFHKFIKTYIHSATSL